MHESWKPFLNSEFAQPYFKELAAFLTEAYETKTIFPPKQFVFSAFKTNLNDVKVVIIGQDPYHTPGIAHGLSFSVQPGAKIPPSILNIFKEIESDLGREVNRNPYLQRWANQGVLLLNKVLTVEAHLAGSHWGKGWETFTENVIRHIDAADKPIVYMLWGRHAREIKPLIKSKNALVLEAAHPSPLSAHNGFFGCKHFSKANEYLRANNLTEVNW
ncbi:MAG: uracil-DNA glycosylase [Candidatus Nomurabacteria bacterium]|jgi:uracil-DNA glycosylase|nr:uracil-DNA glycosylase [Candidatus Nomurabacteria bacterium]